MDRNALIAALRAHLERAPGILAAWLYGSQARGTATTSSDVDVAVLTGAGPPRALEDLPFDLEDALGRAVGHGVQVVIADHAPTDLVHRILRDGVLLVDRDRSRRLRFEVEARNRYFDMVPIWRQYRRGGTAA